MIYINEFTEIKKASSKMSPRQINEVSLQLLRAYRIENNTEKKKDLRDRLLAVCGKIIEMNASKVLFATEMFEWDDLYNEGIIIAIKAIDNYDFENKGGSGFVTYLTHALNHTLKRRINYNDRRVVISESTLLKEAKKRKEGAYETTEPGDISTSLVTTNLNESILQLSSEEEQMDQMDQNVLQDVLGKAMKCLSNKELYIVKKRIGFDEVKPVTYKELAEEFNTNPSAIFTLYNKALKKLKIALAESGCESISDFF